MNTPAEKHDPRVDAYIARKADFARPILEQIRAAVHAACPEAEESIKWSAPAFMYKGQILGIMAAFKAHAAFNLWRGTQVTGKTDAGAEAMGQFGRLTSPADLPDAAAMRDLLHKAMALTDAGVKPPSAKKHVPKPPAAIPDDLAASLAGNPAAARTFESFGPGARREYVDWVVEAKRDETRAKRIAQAVEWMAEGKKRNWKYENC